MTGPVSTTTVPLDRAERAIRVARAKAEKLGVRCTVSIIDAGAHLISAARMDGAVLAAVETSQTKARTALMFGAPTRDLAADVLPGGIMFAIGGAMRDPLAFQPGGVPVIGSDGVLLGAIGVGGGASDQDHEIALAALMALGELTPPADPRPDRSASRRGAGMVTSFDPRASIAVEDVAPEMAAGEVACACAAAAIIAPKLESLGRRGRARLLRSMADALEADRDLLVAAADRETGLGSVRLGGELTRTTFQLRFFGEVLEDGAYIEAMVDHAGDTPMGPLPDLRRILRPVGPVAVFGASNFPFAFSVPGGDTASALAAGCPVVVKAHEAHPRTSQLSVAALRRGAATAGVAEDVVSLIFGRDAGIDLVEDPHIRAVGFTGSLGGGQYLYNRASARPSPIPFYGELGALNAVVVCPAAAAARSEEIAAGLARSFTAGVGQFCTKPGLALLPAGAAGDAVVATLAGEVKTRAAGVMLSSHVHESFVRRSGTLSHAPGVTVLAEGMPAEAKVGWWGTALLLEVEANSLSGVVLDECFGPVLEIVRYGSEEELAELLGRLGPALTATVHADLDDGALAGRLLDEVSGCVGRVVWNMYPTGVAVTWATHHGGPYPSTTHALHTSVGATAIRRWLRPVAYQGVPEALLPPELRDSPPLDHRVPRRVDGRLTLP